MTCTGGFTLSAALGLDATPSDRSRKIHGARMTSPCWGCLNLASQTGLLCCLKPLKASPSCNLTFEWKCLGCSMTAPTQIELHCGQHLCARSSEQPDRDAVNGRVSRCNQQAVPEDQLPM